MQDYLPPQLPAQTSIEGIYLDSELPGGEVNLLLLLLLDNASSVLGRKSPPDSAGLLAAEIEREVLLLLVEETELGALVRVGDGEDTSDRLADVVTIRRIPC